MNVYGVGLNWENAFGKEFKIQISDDAEHWTDAAHERTGKAGKQDIFFDDVKGRYVKVQGIRRGTGYGYSLYEMKVYGGEEHQAGLSDVHLIRLTLRDARRQGRRPQHLLARTETHRLHGAQHPAGTPSEGAAEGPHRRRQIRGRSEGHEPRLVPGRIVRNLGAAPPSPEQRTHPPALYDDNYFMLLPGETQTVHVEFDKELLGDAAQPS